MLGNRDVNHFKQLVVNWHLLEACNYSCNFCFAKWDGGNSGIVAKDPSKRRKVLSELAKLTGRVNEIGGSLVKCENVRLNIAGGEPFLLKDISDIVKEAYDYGLSLSFISNGSLIGAGFIETCAPLLETAGFSVDSFVHETSEQIGRHDNKGRQLGYERLRKLIDQFRDHNPQIKIKLNTVVCRENADENMVERIQSLDLDRWKVFRVLPSLETVRSIPRESYNQFLERHKEIKVMVPEDNDEMSDSYIMIDPQGRFFVNGEAKKTKKYQYSSPIQSVGVESALAEVRFRPSLFAARY